jgi:serine/threonine-protein kinase
MDLETGAHVGAYRIVRRLGRGATGVVYQAAHQEFGDVALKMLLSEVASDESARARFIREAETLVRLRHRNIVTIYEGGMSDDTPFLAMELLSGTTLAARLASGESMSLQRKLDIIIQLCDGLQFVHERGVIHRDVKPANVWVMSNAGVKLLDFGTARILGSSFTRAGDVVGSAAYMAPEQVAARDVDGRADVFATGVMLYELLTGRRPFDADGIAAVMNRILYEPPTPLASLVPGISRDIALAVETALEKDVNLRYLQAADFGSDLRLARYAVEQDSAGAASSSRTSGARFAPPDPADSNVTLISGSRTAGGTPIPPSTATARTEDPPATIVSASHSRRLPDIGPPDPDLVETVVPGVEPRATGAGSPPPPSTSASASQSLPTSASQSTATSASRSTAASASRSTPTSASRSTPTSASRSTPTSASRSTSTSASRATSTSTSTPTPTPVRIRTAPPKPAQPQPALPGFATEAAAWIRSRPWPVVAGGITLTAAVVVAVVLATRQPPPSPQFRLDVRSQPSGALIEIDGRPTGQRTPAAVTLATKPSRLRVAAPGYETLDADVAAVSTTEPLVLSLTLRRLVRVDSKPAGARILVNGHDTGLVTPAEVPVDVQSPPTVQLELGRQLRGEVRITDATLQSGMVNVALAQPRTSVPPVVPAGNGTTPAPPPPADPSPAPPPPARRVAVHVTGSYPFEVSGCERTSPAATVHDLEVSAPCTLRLRAPKYYLDETRTIGAAGGRIEIAAPQLARVQLRSKYETCTVILDGRAVGSPPIDLELAAGTYRAEIQCRDRTYPIRELKIEPGQTSRRLDDLLP